MTAAMKILDKAVKLEKALVERLGRRGDIARHPIELYQAILDDIEDATEAGPRGTRIFPYNVVHVTIAATDERQRATTAAVFAQSPSLETRLRTRLQQAGCGDVDRISVVLKFVDAPRAAWSRREYHLELRRQTSKPRTVRDTTPVAQALELQLAITAGTAAKSRYSFGATRINLGRLSDVVDGHHRVVRQNHVAFVDDEDDVSQSVSRTHAHISLDTATNTPRLHDDGSTHGTRIARAGRTIAVPRGGRGVALHDGDEILLGQARLRLTLRPARNR